MKFTKAALKEMEKRKDCPFCGSIPFLNSGNTDLGKASYWMQCLSCNAMSQEAFTKKEAYSNWDRRIRD